MKKLFLIPARGGSKGLPRKNILPLAGKPMIYYTLDAAAGAAESQDVICVSTDDEEIKEVVEEYGLQVPFLRPAELASDTAGTEEVLQHALQWFSNQGEEFDVIVLLQVTSPLRTFSHVKNAISMWNNELDMIVSVKETDSNPYYVLFEEDECGFLKKSKTGGFKRRQDCPEVFEYNGAIYIINRQSFEHKGFAGMKKIVKSLMSKRSSVDVDDYIDFKLAEMLIREER